MIIDIKSLFKLLALVVLSSLFIVLPMEFKPNILAIIIEFSGAEVIKKGEDMINKNHKNALVIFIYGNKYGRLKRLIDPEKVVKRHTFPPTGLYFYVWTFFYLFLYIFSLSAIIKPWR